MPFKLPFRRRNFLINPDFQIRFIGFMALLALVVIAIAFGTNELFFLKFYQKANAAGLPRDHVFLRFIDHQRSTMHTIFLATGSCMFFVIFFAGLFFSHKIAGPIYRIDTDMKRMISGTKPFPIRFRKRDFFQDLATTFNAFQDHHRNTKLPTHEE